MKPNAKIIIAAVIILLAGAALHGETPAPPKNLVKNGDFESGKKLPDGWERPDLLTSLWVKDKSTSGKLTRCIKMDTDVYMSDWKRRREELKKNPDAPPWHKTPTSGKKYNTIAGNNGVSLYGDPIPVKKAKTYTLRVDVKSNKYHATPKVFIKGYALHKGRMRVIYKTYLNCRLNGQGWQHFTQNFNPTSRTPKVTEMRVMLFAYWPPGQYFFDNVKITQVPETPASNLKAKTLVRRGGDN